MKGEKNSQQIQLYTLACKTEIANYTEGETGDCGEKKDKGVQYQSESLIKI